LSIISGSNEPIVKEILLTLYCLNFGISVNIKGAAIWNMG
jgi:hypothetical protein